MVRGHNDGAHQAAALAAFGVQPDAPPGDAQPLLVADLMPVVELFAAMTSQWNVAPMGGLLGMRYEALPIAREACGIPAADWPDVFADLQLMEFHAMELRNQKH